MQNLNLESEVRSRTIEITRQSEHLLMINAELQHLPNWHRTICRRPLRTISVFCGKLSQNSRVHFDVESCQDMDLVIEAAKKMRQLILDVITYSHVQNHSDVFTEILLEDSLVEVIRNLHSEIHDSAAIVKYAQLPPLFSNRRLLICLLQNLIGNSLKYRGEQAPQIHISSQRRAHAWEISVADNGIGIAPRHHERVFELFKRLHGQVIIQERGSVSPFASALSNCMVGTSGSSQAGIRSNRPLHHPPIERLQPSRRQYVNPGGVAARALTRLLERGLRCAPSPTQPPSRPRHAS